MKMKKIPQISHLWDFGFEIDYLFEFKEYRF